MCVLLGVAEGVGARAGQNPLSHGEAARGGGQRHPCLPAGRGQQRLAPGAGPGWDPAATPAATLSEISAGTPATTRLRSQLRPQPRPRPQLQPRPWPQPRLRPPAETRLSPGRLPGGVLALSVWAVCSQMF